MYQRIVLTAGISILTNKREQIEAYYPDFFSQDEKIIKENEREIEEIISFLKHEIYKEPFDDRLSAEISMIATLERQHKLHKNPVIIIFHTDTMKGIISATIIKDILEKQCSAIIRLKKIYDVDVENRVKLSKSLGYFLSKVSEELLEGNPYFTCFAPIGGYKVFTSLGYLVGAFHRYPTAYLHEHSTVLHEIPPVQIQVNEDFIEDNRQFLRKMLREDIVEMKDLSEIEKKIIEKEPTFFTVEEDLVELNPFGRFLCSQAKFSHYFQPSVSIDRAVLRWIQTKYQSFFQHVLAEIHDLMIKHRDFPTEYRSFLYHESDFTQLNSKKLDCHLFKGGNKPVFRAIWHYDKKEDHYYIGKIWFDHDEYERQAVSYVQSFDRKQINWENITSIVYNNQR